MERSQKISVFNKLDNLAILDMIECTPLYDHLFARRYPLYFINISSKAEKHIFYGESQPLY